VGFGFRRQQRAQHLTKHALASLRQGEVLGDTRGEHDGRSLDAEAQLVRLLGDDHFEQAVQGSHGYHLGPRKLK
jgi:hypothetical protein